MRYGKIPSPEVQEKLRRSRQEVKELTRRELRCPRCNFLIDYIYSDAQGHRESKCQGCKETIILNMAYFRTVKRKYYPRVRWSLPPIR